MNGFHLTEVIINFVLEISFKSLDPLLLEQRKQLKLKGTFAERGNS